MEINLSCKIVHVTTAHPRFDIRIFCKYVKSLSGIGADVCLIVADGKGNTNKDDIEIIDVGRRSGRISRIVMSPFDVLSQLLQLEPCCVHFHDPEFMLCALFLRARGFTVIYDVHEDVPRQILHKQWIPKLTRKLVSRAFEVFELFSASRMSAVVTATDNISNRFLDSAKHIQTVKNYPITSEFTNQRDTTARNKKTLCYVGAISENRGIIPLIKALEQLPDYELVLAGSMQPKSLERKLVKMPGWKQVRYRGVVGRKAVVKILRESSVGVVTLLPIDNYLESLPIKMFEYMASNLPVLASDFPAWIPLVEGTGSGLCVTPNDVDALVSQIEKLHSDPLRLAEMGARGRKVVEGKWAWEHEFESLRTVYQHLHILD